uniref:Macaca fascicularis brain cDNA clone: QmoA-11364, similar to human GTPase activating RANGAP domain-like 3 (GARNL3), mRNA, RefSeq: NM_032293.3 n=1 Tax=Macaca fascicularis TaxID=9541 RepID=I7GJ42_MACFA|nr:unnamed protein product [Macaca fascicularis]
MTSLTQVIIPNPSLSLSLIPHTNSASQILSPQTHRASSVTLLSASCY